MREVLHLTPADARRIPWKNGRGVTEELAVWPEDASFERGEFDWRISKAAVDEPGPFSSFPGFERILVITRGEALLLDHADRAPRARVRRFEPYRFSGDWPTTAELPRGPVADFNVLARHGRIQALVQVLELGRRSFRESLAPGHAFVHVLSGEVVARVSGEDEPFELARGESLWARELAAGEEVELSGTSAETCALLVIASPTPAA